MTIKYIGLDFEASGSNPWGNHVPIQIGMSFHGISDVEATFESLIGGWSWSEYEWNQEAFGVHGILVEALAAAPPVWVVDIAAAAWLIEQVGHSNRMWNITVGWNVAGYDRQFVTRWMPNLNRILSYRTFDLNTLVFAGSSDEARHKALKNKAKAYADKFNPGGKRHDALVDAQAALHEMDYLVAFLKADPL